MSNNNILGSPIMSSKRLNKMAEDSVNSIFKDNEHINNDLQNK